MLMMMGSITFSERSVFSDVVCEEDNEDSLGVTFIRDP